MGEYVSHDSHQIDFFILEYVSARDCVSDFCCFRLGVCIVLQVYDYLLNEHDSHCVGECALLCMCT